MTRSEIGRRCRCRMALYTVSVVWILFPPHARAERSSEADREAGPTRYALGQRAICYVDDDNCPQQEPPLAPEAYCSIQAAIGAAGDGGEIVVAPGTYLETIDFLGKAIWLHSSDGAEVTAINAQGGASAVVCQSAEGLNTVLEGFTITGSGNDTYGAGMKNVDSSPTVRRCTFRGNRGDYGGGMQNGRSHAVVEHCQFSNNEATWGGGGMYNYDSHLTISNSVFRANSVDGRRQDVIAIPPSQQVDHDGAVMTPGGGAGMVHDGGGPSAYASPLSLTACSFRGNNADRSGGAVQSFGPLIATACLFASNRQPTSSTPSSVRTRPRTVEACSVIEVSPMSCSVRCKTRQSWAASSS